jgi:hypothetical protein
MLVSEVSLFSVAGHDGVPELLGQKSRLQDIRKKGSTRMLERSKILEKAGVLLLPWVFGFLPVEVSRDGILPFPIRQGKEGHHRNLIENQISGFFGK